MARIIEQPIATKAAGLRQWARWLRVAGGLPALALVLGAALVLATAIGATVIDPWHTAQILLNAAHLTWFRQTWDSIDATIILGVRLPHVLGAALVGAALGVSGTIFQGLLRNPLADPLLLGTSSGAALGVTLAFFTPALFTVTWFGFGLAAICAFVGALLAAAIVYRLATRRGQTPVVTLLLAGVAVSAILTAFQTLLTSLSTRLGLKLYSLYAWITGEVSVQDWSQVVIAGILILLSVALAIAIAPWLDAFALGEEMAGNLGLRVERAKILLVVLAAILVAAAVACSGLVGFVGLVAPHVCRLLFGPRHRLLIPATALAGALFVVLADLLARTLLAPSIMPLGVITALAGGPFFLWLLARSGNGYRW